MDFKNLPQKPGVYLFKDGQDEVLYVGKALNIKERVKTHLANEDPKTSLFIQKANKVDYIEVGSELEALILEANLIKKYKPYFNVRLKDDKDYLYIKITNELYPKVITARKKDLKGAKKFFGPYPTAKIVRSTLRSLRKFFPFCANPPKTTQTNPGGWRENRPCFLASETSAKARPLRPCFYYHIGLCPGACVGKVSRTEYLKIINRFGSFLSGNKEKVIKELKTEMEKRGKKLDFEGALKVRDQIQGIEYITSQARSAFLYEANPNYIIEERTRALKSLKDLLNLPTLPVRIECYDISNLYGQNATGSMTVFENGDAAKSEYRRFKIKRVTGINDYGMMEEILKRRFGNEWVKPDLIVVDGGKGQLNTAVKVLEILGLTIPIISLAKREEEIYVPGKDLPLRLTRDSVALQLIQRIRDEAHRFAISYHRKLRLKTFILNEKFN